ncbi:hypothetical protein [Beggiatoa leptomitoformis]|uniref:Transposase n=1 Tax=Beggiatoa leptomitoformis TaxID=288004 RepID=A0A2N9YFD5_9GAMM|nr:hypothetical protein [Beggiatoa leptomitoformis]ALG68460.1 hypothetical protein AL038_13075 [Beggiatoa leptomitoformis]AUI69208.1 hypothetical protein BLE401_11195 [Beggiatoa leptomitoformis]
MTYSIDFRKKVLKVKQEENLARYQVSLGNAYSPSSAWRVLERPTLKSACTRQAELAKQALPSRAW